jgi:predicted nucleic acid-binding protein
MTAEEVYVDPSALARLYLHQVGSREMSAWRARLTAADSHLFMASRFSGNLQRSAGCP